MEKTLINDLGYGELKDKFLGDKESFKVPSVIAIEREQDVQKPVEFDTKQEEQAYVKDILSHLDVTVQSPTIKLSKRVLVGKSAIRSHLTLTSFDVNDMISKADTDLSVILTLSVIAAQGLKDSYKKSGEIPKNIDMDVSMATALPILEGKADGVVERYKERFTGYEHVVIFHNFDRIVTARIKFNRAVVALEGEAAQYAINQADGELKQAIWADFEAHYGNDRNFEGVTDTMLVSAKNTIGIDIGEGTTDFAVFTDGEVNIPASSSLPSGYGNALEDALTDLQSQKLNISTRAELNDLLNKEPTGLNRGRHKSAQNAVKAQLDNLVNQIVTDLSKVLRATSSSVEVIFVYGGGAVPLMDEYLRDRLMEKTKGFNGASGIPVVYVGDKYAQYLNEQGLEAIANVVLNSDKEA